VNSAHGKHDILQAAGHCSRQKLPSLITDSRHAPETDGFRFGWTSPRAPLIGIRCCDAILSFVCLGESPELARLAAVRTSGVAS
jgi:hypothetical protein